MPWLSSQSKTRGRRKKSGVAYVWLELHELESSTIHRDDVLRFGRALLRVDFGCFHDVGGMLSLLRVDWVSPGWCIRWASGTIETDLAILTFPDEVGIATTALLLILLL